MIDESNEASLEDRVKQALHDEVAPMLELSGEDIEVLGLDGGIVRVRLHGACLACPSAVQTLLFGMEEQLRQRVPEVDYLEVVP